VIGSQGIKENGGGSEIGKKSTNLCACGDKFSICPKEYEALLPINRKEPRNL
jgi:hypothetical protein